MTALEQAQAARALCDWFKSQNISAIDASNLCLVYLATMLAMVADRRPEVIAEGCDMARESLFSIAKNISDANE